MACTVSSPAFTTSTHAAITPEAGALSPARRGLANLLMHKMRGYLCSSSTSISMHLSSKAVKPAKLSTKVEDMSMEGCLQRMRRHNAMSWPAGSEGE
eukprot:scaffold11535_cov135-Isochrysis_galbana.AAC.1